MRGRYDLQLIRGDGTLLHAFYRSSGGAGGGQSRVLEMLKSGLCKRGFAFIFFMNHKHESVTLKLDIHSSGRMLRCRTHDRAGLTRP